MQLFLDHLPIRKGKEEKKRKSVTKGKDGRFRSATAAPSAMAINAPGHPVAASGPNSGATTPNPTTPHPTTPQTQDFGLSQSCLLGDDPAAERSGSEGHDMLLHDIGMHERHAFDDPMHDAIDVT